MLNHLRPTRFFLKLFLFCLMSISIWQLGALAEDINQNNQDKGTAVRLAGADSALSRAPGSVEPVVVPPISFVDVNSGRFGKLEIDLEEAQFLDTAVDKLHLVARNFDVEGGTLKSLSVAIAGGHIHDFIFDQLSMNTSGALKFDPGILLNHRVLQFDQPAQADVSVVVSQASLINF